MEYKINKRIDALSPSSTLAITAKAKALKAEGCDVVNFAGGEPDFDTPDSIKNAAIKAIQQGFTKYTPSIGMPSLREAISEKFKKDNNLDYDPSQVVVSCGAKHTIFSLIQVLADEGDDVLIPGPYWVSYPEMVKIAGATSKIVQTTSETNFKLTVEQLEASITDKTKVLLLNSPSNPTGMLYTKEELEPIAELCVKNDIIVISDEIYEKLVYDGAQYVSIASLGKDIYDRTITVNGMSKAFSMTGWRIGYCAGPKVIMAKVKNLQDHSTSNPCSISQHAALQALKEPVEVIDGMRKIFEERREVVMKALDQIPQLSYIKPQGAFYIFVDVSKLGDSFEVAKGILEDVNVAMIPGEGFGAPGMVRLSFSTSVERIEEGVKRIADWIQKQSA